MVQTPSSAKQKGSSGSVQSASLSQVGWQSMRTTSHPSVGPHWLQDVPGAVPSGQGSGQAISVQTSEPSSHWQVLQLKGSSMPVLPSS